MSGETAEQGLIRELGEEIGAKLSQNELKFLFKCRFRYKNLNNELSYVYKVIYDGQIIMQEDEVSEYEFVHIQDLEKIMAQRKFTPKSKYLFNNHKDVIMRASMQHKKQA